DLFNNGQVAIHWGMTCANDVIEGEVSVPEPTTLALLGIGLLAIPFARPRRRKATLQN
ncbi:MAG: PEP-CTERM sorting domain-containing protein, partial [Gammaproteobacteria bacterium]|nr:PEP-CTERM sorting domain-containing protein [Gammaproteobacteria bacterium]